MSKRVKISDSQYYEMLRRQSGGCAICHALPGTRRLHVDHDHKTDKIRGLLCMRCNRFRVGQNTIETAQAVVAYLIRSLTK